MKADMLFVFPESIDSIDQTTFNEMLQIYKPWVITTVEYLNKPRYTVSSAYTKTHVQEDYNLLTTAVYYLT